MKQLCYSLLIGLLLGCLNLQAADKTNYDSLLVGNHMLSLQWISWDVFGSAAITKEGDHYKIKGQQKTKKNSDYLTIEGTLTPVNARHLVFNGKIITQVSHINGGQAVVREGKFNFKVTGNRKYWRLQEMYNPNEEVVDYVDIYFLRQ